MAKKIDDIRTLTEAAEYAAAGAVAAAKRGWNDIASMYTLVRSYTALPGTRVEFIVGQLREVNAFADGKARGSGTPAFDLQPPPKLPPPGGNGLGLSPMVLAAIGIGAYLLFSRRGR